MEKMNWNAASVRMAAASIVSALVAAAVVMVMDGKSYLPGAGLSISLLLVLLVGLLAGGRSPRGAREWRSSPRALWRIDVFLLYEHLPAAGEPAGRGGAYGADAVFAERPPESRRGGSGRARRNAADSAARVRPIHTGAVPRAAAGEDFHGNRGGVDHLRARAGRGDAASVLG